VPFAYYDVTGEGSVTLAGVIQVQGLEGKLTVAGPLTQFRSATYPRRIMHAGWYNVYISSGAFGTPAVTFARYIEWQDQYDDMHLLSVYGDRLGYSLPPGVTVRLGLST
jgi:hypothetical protein